MPRHPNPRTAPARARHFQLEGTLAAGAVVAEGGTKRELIATAGHLRGRVRAKLSAGTGTLRVRFPKPTVGGEPEDTFEQPTASGSYTAAHTTGAPSDVNIPDTNEVKLDIDDFYGEAYMLVEVIDAGNGGATATIDHVVVSLL